jgi:DNA repair protein RadC
MSEIAQAMRALLSRLKRDGLPVINDTRLVATDALLRLHDESVEVALAYWLDSNLRLLGVEEFSRGGEIAATLSPRYLCRLALAADAEMVVVAHNHPLPDPTPSQDDIDTANKIDRTLAAIGVMVVAHMVVSREGIADVRTGRITRLADLEPDAPQTISGPRCPHCHGLLEVTP